MKEMSHIRKNQKGLSKIAYLVAAVIVIALLAFVFFGNSKEACGNGVCRPEKGETCASCSEDCGPCHAAAVCGDGKCDKDLGEDCNSCPSDCGTCPAVSTTTTSALTTTSASTTTTSREEPMDVCGDGICGQTENCWDCPQDCKCAVGEYCSSEEKKCLKPVCGNQKCEIFENSANCCIDCPCEISYTKCNNETKACETPSMAIGDEEIKKIVSDYYGKKSMQTETITPKDVYVWGGKVGRKTEVKLAGDSSLKYVLVTDAKEVIELPFF